MRIIRSRHSDLIELTNHSSNAFKFGERAGSGTDFTPPLSRSARNFLVNRDGRPWITAPGSEHKNTIRIRPQLPSPNRLTIHAYCCNRISGHYG